MPVSRRVQENNAVFDSEATWSVEEAVRLCKETATANFNESIDAAISLGIQPAKEGVRGGCSLRHGTGREVRIAVFAEGSQAEDAKKSGADTVGMEEISEALKKKCDYDIIIATPEAMRSHVSKLAKILGPKGLMPNPKVGTVSSDIGSAVAQAKAGQVFYRNDKAGIVHCSIGRSNFEMAQLVENLTDLMQALLKAKPSTAKGKYFVSLALSATMGPGINVDLSTIKLS